MEEDNVGVTSLDLVVGKLLARCAEKLCTTRRCKYDSVSYIDSKGAEHVEEPLNYY